MLVINVPRERSTCRQDIPTLPKAPTDWKLTEKPGFKDIILTKDMSSPFRCAKLQLLAGELEEDEFDDHDDEGCAVILL